MSNARVYQEALVASLELRAKRAEERGGTSVIEIQQLLVRERLELARMPEEKEARVRLKYRKKEVPSGYGLTLGRVEERNRAPDKLLKPLVESFGTKFGENNNPETLGDGCGSWSRSWAGRTGKHSGRTASDREDYEKEMERRVAGPTYQRSLVGREERRKVSNQAITELLTKRASALAEISGLLEGDAFEDDSSYELTRVLTWVPV